MCVRATLSRAFRVSEPGELSCPGVLPLNGHSFTQEKFEGWLDLGWELGTCEQFCFLKLFEGTGKQEPFPPLLLGFLKPMIAAILPAELSPLCNWPHWISGCPFYRRETQGQEKWVTCSSHWAGTTEEPVDGGYRCPKAPDWGGFKWPGLAPGLEPWTGWLLIQPEAVRAATRDLEGCPDFTQLRCHPTPPWAPRQPPGTTI